MTRRTLTLHLEPTTRTDLLCIGCGRFVLRGDKADAVLPQDGGEPEFALHRKCDGRVRARRQRKWKSPRTPHPALMKWRDEEEKEARGLLPPVEESCDDITAGGNPVRGGP